jgi:hypothetical protein
VRLRVADAEGQQEVDHVAQRAQEDVAREELLVLQEEGIAPQRALGGDHQVELLEVLLLPPPAEAGVVEHAQLRREALRLAPPVEDQRPRQHDEVGPGRPSGPIPRVPGPASFSRGTTESYTERQKRAAPTIRARSSSSMRRGALRSFIRFAGYDGASPTAVVEVTGGTLYGAT